LKYNVIKFKSDLVLPYEFVGSAIRGVIGVALKKIVCINKTKECKGCFAKDGCLFYDFYESFAKFRLKISLGGKVEFELFLFEEYANKAPFMISAIYNAFTILGITKQKIKPDFKLYLNDNLIYDKEFFEYKNEVLEFIPKKGNRLVINTPIRLKQKGKFKNYLTLEDILTSINHRKLKLQNKEIIPLNFTPEYKIKNQYFNFKNLTRYSNRQKTKMFLGGVLGMIEFECIDEKSLELLSLGEIIGVAKQVTFGLGDISLL